MISLLDSNRHDPASGSPLSVAAVDFQLIHRNRPGIDLVYFFFTSTDPDFREKHLDDLLKSYHGELVGHLDGFGYQGESLICFQDLKKQYKECYMFGLHFTVVHYTVRHGNLIIVKTRTE